jgi:hypothetical protein
MTIGATFSPDRRASDKPEVSVARAPAARKDDDTGPSAEVLFDVRMKLAIVVLALVAGCESEPPAGADGGSPSSDAGAPRDDAGSDGEADAGSSGEDAGPSDAGRAGGAAAEWIMAELGGADSMTGDFTARTRVETPALVHDATACCAKYAFDLREEEAPDDRRVGFVNVMIRDLVSSDAFGGGITSGYDPGVVIFMANVTVEPNWPTWVDYDTTNKDGLVLDDTEAIYAEDLTIRNWNADGAIDNKANFSQFVRLTIEGRGNRGIRYWRAGPHYLVDSSLENEGGLGEGSVLWFSNCDTVEVRIYDSTFNGSETVPEELIGCDDGSDPNLVYLTTDPRTTGEMHEMFSP